LVNAGDQYAIQIKSDPAASSADRFFLFLVSLAGCGIAAAAR
jgi:hypothetical protein